MTTPFDIVSTALPPPSPAGGSARAQEREKPVEPTAPLRAPAREVRGRVPERQGGHDEARQPRSPVREARPVHQRPGEVVSSGAFLTQLIAQDATGEPTASAAGSEAYRRAGGAPPFYTSTPVVFRIEV